MKKREEIINTFDKNYLLEAGAGAGKTTIIVQRIINHIISSNINPANLVAITFTKAASTELAERIQLKALEYLKKETNPETIKRLNAVDRIFTGTIHSFCELILREMPFDANMTPNYEIIDDDQEFHNDIWYKFLRDKQEEYKEIVELLREVNIDYKELRNKAILALENPDINFVGYENTSYSLGDIEEEFSDIRNKYGDLSGEPFKNNSNIAKLFRSILEEKEELRYYLNGLLKEFGKDEFDTEVVFEKVIAKKHQDSPNTDEYKDFIDDMYNIYYKTNALIYNSCTDFINMVVEYKKERYQGKLTFNELLYKASSLIKESPLAKEHFRNKYKYFYIDEFQDTDPMQAELILHLTDEGDTKRHWYDCKPQSGSLFVVGDPKQSIYRFRRADISIYNQVKEIISKNGEVVYLDINFRSSDEICGWVENAFKKKDNDFGFGENATMVQAGFKGILSLWDTGESEDKTAKGIYQYNYPEKEDQDYVANIVEDIINNYFIKEKVMKSKDYHNISRKAKEGDIMILTKANEETGFYLRALKDRGISSVLAGEKNLGDNREVLNLFILIDALVDYRDTIKVVSALRNSFYLDLETIELFMEENRNLSQYIFFKNKIDKIEHFSIRRAFVNINEMVNLSRELSPIAFIEKIVENKVGIYHIHREYESLETRDAESALRQTMEILKSKNCGSIYEIREELRNLLSTKVNYELPINKDEAQNAVRIMNIHKAKGLESNIVILTGGDKKRTVSSSSHYIEKHKENGNIGFIAYGEKHSILGPEENQRKEKEKLYKEGEIDRLLYVAATRAKSALIIASTSEERNFLYHLSKDIDKEIKPENIVEKSIRHMELSKEKIKERQITEDLRIKKEISSPSYTKVTPSQFKTSMEELNISKNSTRYISPKIKNNRILKPKVMGPRGKIYGTIIHRAMEILIKGNNGLSEAKDSIPYAVKVAVDENIDNLEINKANIGLFYPLMNEKIDEIISISVVKGNKEARNILKKRLYKYGNQVLRSFINNEEIKEIFNNAKNIFPELPFTIAIDKKNGDTLYKVLNLLNEVKLSENKSILINGTIDLVIESKDGEWTILDYKTDVYPDKDMERRLRRSYTSQLEGYKILFEEIMKSKDIKVENLLFYSTFNDKVINVYGKALT